VQPLTPHVPPDCIRDTLAPHLYHGSQFRPGVSVGELDESGGDRGTDDVVDTDGEERHARALVKEREICTSEVRRCHTARLCVYGRGVRVCEYLLS